MQAGAQDLRGVIDFTPALELCARALTASKQPSLISTALEVLRHVLPCAPPAAVFDSSLADTLLELFAQGSHTATLELLTLVRCCCAYCGTVPGAQAAAPPCRLPLTACGWQACACTCCHANVCMPAGQLAGCSPAAGPSQPVAGRHVHARAVSPACACQWGSWLAGAAEGLQRACEEPTM
jgi:hypothetical protein